MIEAVSKDLGIEHGGLPDGYVVLFQSQCDYSHHECVYIHIQVELVELPASTPLLLNVKYNGIEDIHQGLQY